MNAKLVTARFFMERMLPETAAHLARIQSRRRQRDGIAGGGVLERGNYQRISRKLRLPGGCERQFPL